MFTLNESGLDRALRTLLGLAVLSLVFIGPKTLWGLLGLIPLVTGVVGFCPFYRLFNVSTRRASPPAAGKTA